MTSGPTRDRIKAYHRSKLGTGVFSSVFLFLLLLIMVASGLSESLAGLARAAGHGRWGALLIFTALAGALAALAMLPFGFHAGYVIEHRYGLSTQTVGGWLRERLTGWLIGGPLGLGGAAVVYGTLREFGALWWLPAGAVFALVSIVLARIAPLVLVPLFYRLTPLEEGPLRETIDRLCRRAGIAVSGIVRFDLSKNTRKANAAFTGLGSTRRVLLGDTLLAEFTDDEIETVVAHELGHAVHGHIARSIAWGTALSLGGLAASTLLYRWSLAAMGFAAMTDLAALPLLALWIGLTGTLTAPLGNLLSRRHERQADRYAVQATGKKAAFASALRKLERTNLADPWPHPVVEALFSSHPATGRRIATVEAL